MLFEDLKLTISILEEILYKNELAVDKYLYEHYRSIKKCYRHVDILKKELLEQDSVFYFFELNRALNKYFSLLFFLEIKGEKNNIFKVFENCARINYYAQDAKIHYVEEANKFHYISYDFSRFSNQKNLCTKTIKVSIDKDLIEELTETLIILKKYMTLLQDCMPRKLNVKDLFCQE